MKLERKINFWDRKKLIGVKGETRKVETISNVINSYLESEPRELHAKVKRINGIYYFNVFIPENDFVRVKDYLPIYQIKEVLKND